LTHAYAALYSTDPDRYIKLVFDSIKSQPTVVYRFTNLRARRGTRIQVLLHRRGQDLPHRRRYGDTGGAEDRAAGPLHVAPQQEPLALLFDLHYLQPVEVRNHVGPLQLVTG